MRKWHRYEWPGGARIAVVIQVPFELWEGNDVDQLSIVPKLPEDMLESGHPDLLNESLQRYGGEIGMWRIIELLDRYGLPAMGVFSGMAVERYSNVVKAFMDGAEGREICAHSWAQDIKSYRLSPDEMRANIQRCKKVITDVAGHPPVGWVSPGGQFLDSTVELLAEEGFIYHADYADSDSGYVIDVNGRRLVAMSVPWIANDALQYAWALNPPSGFVELFKREFDVLYREGGQVVGAVPHAFIYGRPFGISAIEEVISYASGHSDVWFANRAQIADVILQQDR